VLKAKPSKSKTNTGPAYSYVSMVGDLIETHKTWAECEARVKGKSGAKFKKAKTIEEESDIISEWTALKRE
jgi:ribonuclease HI